MKEEYKKLRQCLFGNEKEFKQFRQVLVYGAFL